MANKMIYIEDMTCDHCVETINNAINKISGIKKLEIDLENKLVVVDFDSIQTNLDRIKSTIKQVGFEAKIKN